MTLAKINPLDVSQNRDPLRYWQRRNLLIGLVASVEKWEAANQQTIFFRTWLQYFEKGGFPQALLFEQFNVNRVKWFAVKGERPPAV